MKTKICSKCHKKLPATVEYFYQDKHHKNGLCSRCKNCMHAANKEYRQSRKGKTTCKEYRQTEKGKAIQKKWRESKKGRGYRLEYAYSITLNNYNKILKKQNGVCAICGDINTNGYRLSVDHSHKTGEIRGLLCIRCNTLLGLCCDNTTFLQSAVYYLNPMKRMT